MTPEQTIRAAFAPDSGPVSDQELNDQETKELNAIDAITKYLSRSDPANRWVARMNATGDTCTVRSPAEAIGVRNSVALNILHPHEESSVKRSASQRIGLAIAILDSALFWWRSDVIEAIKSCPPTKAYVVKRPQFPFAGTFHIFEDTRLGWGTYNYFEENEEGLSCVMEGLDDPDRPDIHSDYHWQMSNWGAMSDVAANPNEASVAASVRDHALLLSAFLFSDYVVKSSQMADRATRRAALRVGDDLPEISVVTLRRREAAGKTSSDEPCGQWRHRWWVRGHRRNQWFSSLQDHRMAWIAPYVKGPKDRPFIEKVYAVKQ